MRTYLIPGKTLLVAIGASVIAVLAMRVAGADVVLSSHIAAVLAGALAILAAADYALSRRAWRKAAPVLLRRLPAALAIGARRPVHLAIELQGASRWRCRLHDHADPSVSTDGLPVDLALHGGQRAEVSYGVVPSRRGEVQFAPADVRVRSRLGFWELLERLGDRESRRVYPDFAQVARYAWLAGDRRLSEIGIKTYQQRGEGTDFKQLSEYRIGDSVRHIDWKATLRAGKPIIREFQNERDQCVMLLIDCGRRLRADDRRSGNGAAHFDQVLNAVMLLSYVALKQGDAVGAMTFGTPAGEERYFAPRKGAATLNALMAELYAVQPTPTHSDYVSAAKELLRRHAKRSLVIVITNFRDEDGTELAHALRLMRSRHLVLLASLRERIVRELVSQPITSGNAAIDIASAHLYEQARRDAFNRLAAKDALMVDAEPTKLGVELVNRYHAVKRAGII
jgi:uncharacterized protein (DUF58 family)